MKLSEEIPVQKARISERGLIRSVCIDVNSSLSGDFHHNKGVNLLGLQNYLNVCLIRNLKEDAETASVEFSHYGRTHWLQSKYGGRPMDSVEVDAVEIKLRRISVAPDPSRLTRSQMDINQGDRVIYEIALNDLEKLILAKSIKFRLEGLKGNISGEISQAQAEEFRKHRSYILDVKIPKKKKQQKDLFNKILKGFSN